MRVWLLVPIKKQIEIFHFQQFQVSLCLFASFTLIFKSSLVF